MLASFKKVRVYITFTLLFPLHLSAQTRLEQYIERGIQDNKGLKQMQFQLDKSLHALKEASSYFLPAVSLQGNYLRSSGGRTIDFPIGDLLNPVYNSLNELTQSNQFPSLRNESIQLNPDNFYDLKVHTTLPLINAEIWYARQIRREMISEKQAAVNVYKRQLIKEIKTAYFRYIQADKTVSIYKSAQELVAENIRINESMVRHGVRNGTALNRARTEKQKTDAALTAATYERRNAQGYFNFLLNQPLNMEIEIDSMELTSEVNAMNEEYGRDEIKQLQSLRQVQLLNRNLQQSAALPKLNTFLDLGSQAFDGQFDNKSRYFIWGLNLQWDLFAGGIKHHRVRQAQIEYESVNEKIRETENLIELQILQARNQYNAALVSLYSARNQVKLARKYYQDQLTTYKEGQLLYIELLDARNELTNAELKESLDYANVQIAAAELERTRASYPLN